MARRKIEKRHIRNLQKIKSSYYVSVPVDLIRKLGWQKGQRVEVDTYGSKKLLIKDWSR